MITKNVKLYLGDEFPVRIPVSQYDTMWQFVFEIIHNSQPWQIPTGATAVLNGKKPDGNVFAFSGTIADNKVTVDADIQMTAVSGQTVCELSILADGKTVGTANFILDVEEAPKSADDVVSDTVLDGYGMMVTNAVDDYIEQHPEVFGGDKFTTSAKNALLALLEKVAYIDENGQTYIDALESELFPPVSLLSITAVFNQGSATIYDTDTLDVLNQYLTVTANMSDGTTQTVTNYTLSGTLTEGTSTITVTYGGKSTTFNATVSADDRKVLKYAIGGIDTEGADIVAPNRIRTDFIPVSTNDLVVTGTELDFTIRLYDANKAYVGANGAFVKYYKATNDGYVRLIFKKSDNSNFTAHELDEYVVDTSADYYFLGAQPSEIPNLVIQNGVGIDASTGASVANANRALSAVSPISYSPLMVHYITEEESTVQMAPKFVDSSGNVIMSAVPKYSPFGGGTFGQETGVLFMCSTEENSYIPYALPSGAVGTRILFANAEGSSMPISSIPSGRVIINGKIYNAVEGTL